MSRSLRSTVVRYLFVTVFHRYVAMGDSFTEGVGDPDPDRPNGLRGWADRFAEALAASEPDFRYANLAIRGRKLQGIVDEQLAPALALSPDLVTIHAGANDVLRPRVDIDAMMTTYDDAVGQLAAAGAHVVMFTIFDPGAGGIYGPVRGRMATFNEFAREIAEKHGATLVDMWRMRDVDLNQIMDSDRMHLNGHGHQLIAIEVLKALQADHSLSPLDTIDIPVLSRREQASENLRWTKEFLGPWIHRRVTGRSSGDGISPKRPALEPITPAG